MPIWNPRSEQARRICVVIFAVIWSCGTAATSVAQTTRMTQAGNPDIMVVTFLNGEFTQINASFAAHEKSLNDHGNQIAALQDSAKQDGEEVKQLKENVRQLTQSIDALTKRIDDLEQERRVK